MTVSVSNLGIDGLEDVQQIGAGGSSRVYRARQADLDRVVAVKVLNPGHDQNVAKRFDRERKAMGRLSLHEGIVPVYSTGLTAHNEPYLVMPFYANGSLQDQINAGALEWQDAVSYVDVAAETIAEAHDEGVVHLDLKPANILLTSGGAPRIADFGIAKLTSGQGASAGTTQGAAFTPAYSAPETFLEGETGPPSDVYGLGATLWALLVGHPPFLTPGDDTNLMAVIGRVVNNPVGDLRHFTPEPICDVIERAMAKRPEDRYQTAREFSLALKQAAAAVPPEYHPQLEPNGTAIFPAAGPAGAAGETHIHSGLDNVGPSVPAAAAVPPPSPAGQKPLLEQEAHQTSEPVGAAPPLAGTPFLDLDRFRFGPFLVGALAFFGVIGVAYLGLNRNSSTAADQDVAITITVPAGPEISQDDGDDPAPLVGEGTVVPTTTFNGDSPGPDDEETAETATTVVDEEPTPTTEAEAEPTPTTEVEEEPTPTTEPEEEEEEPTTTTEPEEEEEEEETTTTTTTEPEEEEEETTTTTTEPEEETTTTTLAPVEAPTDLAASLSDNDVSLTWSRPADGPVPDRYDVLRNGLRVGTAQATSFADTNVQPGTYSYIVRSVGEDGTSADSNRVTVTVEPEPEPEPNPDPTSVDASGEAGSNSITVTMTADSCFTAYRLRAIPAGNQPQPLPIIANDEPCKTSVTRTIPDLESGSEYDITVSVWSTRPSNSVGATFSIKTLPA